MADYGAFIRSSDGSLLVTPDTPCYELDQIVGMQSRTGNVNRYVFACSSYPLVFAACGVNESAGVLSVQATGNNYTVEVLSTIGCPIYVFKIMQGTESGYGMATYASDGSLIFSSNRNVLNVRNAGVISEGGSFASSSGVDMVSYTCGPVRPASSNADRWVFVTTFSELSTDYQCGFETVCRDNFTCGNVRECRVVSFFPYVEECTDNFRCTTTTVCGSEWVCRFVTVSTQYFVSAAIRRTSWHIDRGTARITFGQVTFDWTRHLTGFYDTVLYYTVDSFSSAPFGGSVRPGYVPPGSWAISNIQYEGQLTQGSTFPYTTSRANEIPLTCLTSVRSNYD